MTTGHTFWSGKRVLVTGHTGFKGAWLSLWLTALGARVFGLALSPPTRPSLFELAGIADRVDSQIGDIRNPAVVRRRVTAAAPEVIFHLAAQSLVKASYRQPAATIETNVMGTVHLLEAARAAPTVRALVNVTSDKCYENLQGSRPHSEDDRLGGHDPYSCSKAAAELLTSAWRRSFFAKSSPPVGVATARAGNVVGGGDWAEDRLVPDCVRAISAARAIEIYHPQAIRPWQHVLEPLSGYLKLAQRLYHEPESWSEAWNFGPASHEERPVSWLVAQFTEIWGMGAAWKVVDGPQLHEAASLRIDSAKARSRLAWQPRLDLAEGLRWTVDWYRKVLAGDSAAELTLAQISRYQERELAE